jgi:hypothetical protein
MVVWHLLILRGNWVAIVVMHEGRKGFKQDFPGLCHKDEVYSHRFRGRGIDDNCVKKIGWKN